MLEKSKAQRIFWETAWCSSVANRCLKRRSEIDVSKRRELSLEQSAKEEPVKKNTDTSDTKSQAWFNGLRLLPSNKNGTVNTIRDPVAYITHFWAIIGEIEAEKGYVKAMVPIF